MQISFVRRLDELGRIVIPKEIRNKLGFNSGDLLDMNISSDGLVIQKCNSTFKEDYVNEIINLVDYLSEYDLILTNSESVIGKSSKVEKLVIDDKISDVLKELILEHKSDKFLNGLRISENFYLEGIVYVKALIKESNTIGLLILKVNEDSNDINIFLNMLSKLLMQ